MHEQLPVVSSLESLATSSLCTDQTDFTITPSREPEYYLNIDFPGGSIVVVWVDVSDLDLCLLGPNPLSFDSVYLRGTNGTMASSHFEPVTELPPCSMSLMKAKASYFYLPLLLFPYLELVLFCSSKE